MTKLVYGVFEDEGQAERALADAGASETPDAVILQGHFREEELQIGATQARSSAIVMGLVVGSLGGILAWALLWPGAGVQVSAWAILPMSLMGALFGIVAGAVAGAAEGKDCVRALASEVDQRGRVVVTCELDNDGDAELVSAAFERGGGTRIAAA